MGDILSSEIVKVIYALLPGFITAWIFYGLTAHRRLSPFERTVQALIFTAIIQAIVLVFKGVFLLLGKIYTFSEWNDNASFVFSIILAIVLGLVVSLFANKDWFHKFLRGDFKWSKCLKKIGGITKRTSYPSEWFSAFNEEQKYVVLHLDGDRRLYGWPREWPDHPDSGYFVIEKPYWLLDNGKTSKNESVEKMLISVKDVESVEFLFAPIEIEANI
jgi:hypothetical protein